MKKRMLIFLPVAAFATAFALQASVVFADKTKDDMKKAALMGTYLAAAMHADLLEGIEEAFGYVLLNDMMEKKDFFKKMKDFDVKATKLAVLVKNDNPVAGALDKVVGAKKDLLAKAEAVFKAFEASKKPPKTELSAFESAVDTVTGLYESFMKTAINEDVKAGIAKDPQAHVGMYMVLMQADILEAIEEAMAYPLLGEKVEKEDFANNLKNFDKTAAELERSGSLEKAGALKKDFENLKVDRKKIESSAMAMFKGYEDKGKVDPAAVKTFEADVDALTTALDKTIVDLAKKYFGKQ